MTDEERDQTAASAVAQKVGAVETAEAGARPGMMEQILRRAPNNPPMPGDEIE